MIMPARFDVPLPGARLLALFVLLVSSASASLTRFDIPAQRASTALPLFVRQSGIEVLFIQNELERIQANAVVGEFEASDAIARLLKDTGYAARKNGLKFVIAAAKAPKTGSIEGQVKDDKSGRPVPDARITLFGTALRTVTNRNGRFSFAEVPDGTHALGIAADGMQNTRVTDISVPAGRQVTLGVITIPAKAPGVVQLEDYIVSANKTAGVIELDQYNVEGRKDRPFAANLDLPRSIDDAQPYYIFDRRTISQSGASNVQDFIEQRLTMNSTAGNPPVLNGGNVNGNSSSINLRGLGPESTLVLVDGRRIPGTTFESFDGQPDLNGIPINAIERIEVLPSSASAIYGGGSIGGVLNVILKRDYVGGEIIVGYRDLADGSASRRNLSLTYGLPLEGGRTQLRFSVTRQKDDPLFLRDRADLYRRSVETIQRNFPTFLTNASSPWPGSLPNLAPSSATIPSLILKDGNRSLNSRMTFVSAGTMPTATAAELRDVFIANAGKWMMDVPDSTQSPYGLRSALRAGREATSFNGSVTRIMTSWLKFTAEFKFEENPYSSYNNPWSNSIAISANSAANPFTATIAVQVPNQELYPFVVESESRSAGLSALIDLPLGWSGLVDFSWRNQRSRSSSFIADNVWLGSAITSGAVNPFVDTRVYPLNLSPYTARYSSNGGSTLNALNLRATGDLPALPWGKPNLVTILDLRRIHSPDRFSLVDYDFASSANNSAISRIYEQKSSVYAGAMEMLAPLVRKDTIPGIHQLDLQFAGRIDHSKMSGGAISERTMFERNPPVTTFTGPTLNGRPYFKDASSRTENVTSGLRYFPIKDVMLRASYATGFQPPYPNQVTKNPVPTTASVNDPVTGRLGVLVSTVTGGNPDLKPQNSKAFNAGVVWTPTVAWLKGLRLNAEYNRIRQFDFITGLGAQAIVDNEKLYPGRVERDASGNITQVDASLVNLAQRDSDAIDLNLSYSVRTPYGMLGVRFLETINLSLKTIADPGQPKYELVGFRNEGGVLERMRRADFDWSWRGVRLGWGIKYSSSYSQVGAPGSPRALQGSTSPINYLAAQGSPVIPSQTYHSLTFSYEFERESRSRAGFWRRRLSGMSILGGVDNVFDRVPPLDVYSGASNMYLSRVGDIRLREFWLSVKKEL